MMTLGERMALYQSDLAALSPAGVKQIAMAGLCFGYQINLLETEPNGGTVREMSLLAGDIWRTYRMVIEEECVGDFAQAIETGTAETEWLGAKHESAVRQDAPTTNPTEQHAPASEIAGAVEGEG